MTTQFSLAIDKTVY